MEIQTSVAPAEIQLEVESTKGDIVSTKKCWTLSKCCGRQSSEWEVRKKIRAKRGSLGARCRCRKTVTCHGLRVVEPVYHSGLIPRQMEELEGSFASGQAWKLSLFQDTSDWLPFCAYVQSRRPPGKWTRTGKSDSCGSVTADFVCVCTLRGLLLFKSQDVGGGLLHRATRAQHWQAL